MQPLLLVVDDSRVSRMMIRGKISSAQPNWRILEASSGDEALAMIQSESPNFITMDVNMPGISGYEAIAAIRRLGCNAKIVVLTANIQESSRDKAAQLDVCFVQKPVTETAIAHTLAYFAPTP